MSKQTLPQDILRKYNSQKIDGATYYLHGHVLRAMMEYAKYAVEQANGAEQSTSNCNIPHVVKSVCDCDIPYFPTGDIKWCSKCNRNTVY